MILIKTTVGLFKFPLNLRDSFELTVQNGRISVAHSIHYQLYIKFLLLMYI